ncbi:MbtH family protein [Saccharothrix longispora]|uniref:MbtH family protein n=1 Tax=Saccharothrix longispora TaxID=33920 RepID=UPI0028FDC329|nr:MbtH family NRPS accessory protein [Saccharothrix longispora]MDU0294170.1 MbtH family NRPS accessory protein [Saccharothrix longispora]
MSVENADSREFLVVLNDEEQYSVWFADRDLPAGWRAEGTRGSREDCLAHIDAVWTDMRPRSVREHLAAHGA